MKNIYPSNFDIHLFHEGKLYEAYRTFGAHIHEINEYIITTFCVWAPNAKEVKVIGSFNDWDGQSYEMERLNDGGIWFLSVPRSLDGEMYKYEIVSLSGERLVKTDPFATYTERRPNTSGIIRRERPFLWNDDEWLHSCQMQKVYDKPLFIYEVHFGTWKIKGKEVFYTYKELGDTLVPYLVKHGFTHVELMPLTEHPFDRSWGYQGTGYYAPTSRYGTPEELKYFVNQCHVQNIGVILDWVPGHFCKDAHGLSRFDGSFLYEYETEGDRENYTWGTANFNLHRNEVKSFLISNARYWIEEFHLDGFRIDAVANILYWPNRGELVANNGGIEFLRELNKAVFEYKPNALMMAEDSTDWPLVTAPTHYGGLGFNYKWNMGWMNDFLKYMETPYEERKNVHHLLTFSLLYAFSENYVLPLSHDEVVHGKKSLLDKMPGDYWQKFAQLRLLMGYLVAHPGKKLLFMGSELAPFSEWKDLEQLDWHLLHYDQHLSFNHYFIDLMHLYKDSSSLYEMDHHSDGFQWIDVNNHHQSIISFIRKGTNKEDYLIAVFNFTPIPYHHYRVGVEEAEYYEEIMNSDREVYGGSNQINPVPLVVRNEGFHGLSHSIELTIPPYGFVYLQPVFN
ncbi:1,4-alpha-glucan branching enzyme [Bacillus coahuilensis]|uniref:1,4-alpha-glucan branching enzyme n=1 Tax=Bacillus coahuilensis TaxID=408580 RepID=UPI0001851117|nr:1,4-alpha-glucan branching enzyme [Bacillus coahuilensis]